MDTRHTLTHTAVRSSPSSACGAGGHSTDVVALPPLALGVLHHGHTTPSRPSLPPMNVGDVIGVSCVLDRVCTIMQDCIRQVVFFPPHNPRPDPWAPTRLAHLLAHHVDAPIDARHFQRAT
jgi:hypothetical protein